MAHAATSVVGRPSRKAIVLHAVHGAARLMVLGLMLSACSGETSFALPTWDAGAPGPEYASVCATWAARECAHEATCLQGLYLQWSNPQQCLDREQLDCELRAADPAIDFDAGSVASCAFPASCASPPTASSCWPVGRLPGNAACLRDEDCESAYCDFTSNTACGTCATSHSPPSCSPPCSPNEVCLSAEDGGWSCVALPEAGQPCYTAAGGYLCAGSSACQGSGPGSAGVCAPLLGLGDPCDADAAEAVCFDEYASTYCDGTGHCSPVPSAGYGQLCGADDAGISPECVGWGSCEYAAVPVCVPPAADGALCDDRQGFGCLPPARCIGNVCRFPSFSWCASP